MTRHVRFITRMEQQGQWLYQRRDVAGIIMLPALALAIWHPGFPGAGWSPADFDHLSELCLVISCIGLALRWFIVGSVPADTSVRSTREQRADVLNTTGMYSAVRHPLYLANTIVVSAFVVATGSLWFVAIFLTMYALVIERIIAAEEHFLANRHGRIWLAWAAQTPTFVPNARAWQSADLRFSARTVLRREYNGVFGVALAYCVLDATRDLAVNHQSLRGWLHNDPLWIIALIAATALLAVLRTLKRHTRQLHVSGR